jgi:glycosyltransferase involved in cell wall biosynthesis
MSRTRRPDDPIGNGADGGDGTAHADMLALTVVIPVKNEEQNLARCLAAIGPVAEVMIVDSGSTDATLEIARQSGAKFLKFEWKGGYPKKRNWVLLTQQFRTEWILFLDADEILNPAVRKEISSAIASAKFNGYWLNYANYFLGRPLRFGVPQRKLALFKMASGLYERIDEDLWSPLDMEVHEHPIISGSVGEIRSRIEHNDFRGIDSFVDRHRSYALWEAHRALLLEREANAEARHLTRRQRLKYANVERWWYPWAYFIYAYFFRLGFLDGAAGFHYAFYKAWYFLTIRLTISELRCAQTNEKP